MEPMSLKLPFGDKCTPTLPGVQTWKDFVALGNNQHGDDEQQARSAHHEDQAGRNLNEKVTQIHSTLSR